MCDEFLHALTAPIALLHRSWVHIGCACRQESRPTQVAGTPLYQAPDMLRRDTPYTERVDCWSFGVMMYRTLFGRPPFDGRTRSSLVHNIFYDTSHESNLEALSEQVRSLLQGLLRRDPDARLSSEDTATHPWFNSTRVPDNQPTVDTAPNMAAEPAEPVDGDPATDADPMIFTDPS